MNTTLNQNYKQKLGYHLKRENWFKFVKQKSISKKEHRLSICDKMKIANFILILYNMRLISEEVYNTKYRTFVERLTPFLEDLQNYSKL